MNLFSKISILMLTILLLLALLCGCTDQSKSVNSINQETIMNENETINKYLSENIFKTNSDGKIFCSYKIIDRNESGNTITNYLMVKSEEYYVNDKTLKSGTGVLVPVVIVLEKNIKKYIVTDFKNPLKYNDGTGEAEKLFPDNILKKINSGQFNDKKTIDLLNLNVKAQAENYYKNTNSSN